MYELSNIQHDYDGRTILTIDKLTLSQGEVVAIVGPSGAGKSTLLRLLSFLERPTHGTLTLNDDHAPNLAQRREIALVFQRPSLLKRSVQANIEYGLNVRGQTDVALVEQLKDQLGLTPYTNTPISKLSGGELQRVALARALAIRPRILLLDEPTAHLDPTNVHLIESLVQTANQQGTTVVLVTHNLFQARRIAHRTGLLLNGRLVEVAETSQFFERPQREVTAAFLQGRLIY